MSLKKATTMTDVARKAGVTQSTVSHVLNGTAKISDDVTTKVWQAARELSYQPARAARSVSSGAKSQVIGLVVPDIDNSFYTELAKRAEAAARRSGYLTVLCNTGYRLGVERDYIERLTRDAGGVAGVLLGYQLVSSESYRLLAQSGIPTVALDDFSKAKSYEFPSISVNNLLGGRLVAEHFVKLGRKGVAVSSLANKSRAVSQRIKGFLEAMEELGDPVPESNILIESSPYGRVEDGINVGAKVLVDGSIDAIFATNDYMAFGIMKRLHRHGLKVPEDVAVVGYDNVAFSEVIEPSLTTVAQPLTQLVEAGMDMLLRLAESGEGAPGIEHQTIDPWLIIRGSSLGRA